MWTECRDFIYKNLVRTSQETHYVSTTKPSRLMLFGEIIAVYCENHAEHIRVNTLCGRYVEFLYVKAGGTCTDVRFKMQRKQSRTAVQR
jgi:hypothetical protein